MANISSYSVYIMCSWIPNQCIFYWKNLNHSSTENAASGQKPLHVIYVITYTRLKDRAHLSTFEFFILEKFSCIVVLIVFFVIVQSSGLISVLFRQKMTFFINFISFHIFAIYVGGACWGLPAACRLIAVSGARLPSVDGLTVRYIKNAPLLNLPSKYVCDLFQTCFQYMYVRYKHTGTMLLCLQVALSFI